MSFLAVSIFFTLVTNTVPSGGDYQISHAEGTVAKLDKSGHSDVGWKGDVRGCDQR